MRTGPLAGPVLQLTFLREMQAWLMEVRQRWKMADGFDGNVDRSDAAGYDVVNSDAQVGSPLAGTLICW